MCDSDNCSYIKLYSGGMTMKRALFVTWDRYPNGDAGAVRTHAFAKMFQSLGYEPTVAGMGDATNFEYKEEDGIRYISMRLSASDTISRIKGRLAFHKHLKNILFKKDELWDVIIVSSFPKKTLSFLKKYAKKNSIPLLHDSVEWYSPEQFSLGKLHPSYIIKDRWNRKHIDKSVRVIAISSYLEKHFKSRGILTTRIPVIMDVNRMACDKRIDSQKVVFVYAGSPGKKDYLDVVVKGFANVQSNTSYECRLIGITKEQLVTLCGVEPVYIEKLGDKLCCMGRIPRTQVLEELSKADFTILMRSEEQRYAKAGFPTKFVESLATATPVIANATSDLEMYLKNNENGYIVPNETSDALSKVLSQAMTLSYEERCKMQNKARQTAETYFDYKKYLNNMDLLINNELS